VFLFTAVHFSTPPPSAQMRSAVHFFAPAALLPHQSDTLASLARERYSSLNATLLRQCVGLRRVVYKKLATASPKSKAAKKALYK
jgi:hypothetical protein